MKQPTSKICSKCKEDKVLGDFSNQKQGKYGKNSMCRKCKSAQKKIEYIRNKERVLKVCKAWRARNKDLTRATSKRNYQKKTPKRIVSEVLRYAVKMGRVKKLPCEYPNCKYPQARVCGHHWDYSKPLCVTWLCDKHHPAADIVRRLIDKKVC